MPDISVLIIDDEPSILKAVSMTLKQEHIAVTCADNGTLALDILKANTFDLILLDIIMPDQDGFSILKVIRSSQNYTPVILLSCLLYTSPRPRDRTRSRMPSSA